VINRRAKGEKGFKVAAQLSAVLNPLVERDYDAELGQSPRKSPKPER
jgi:hypothetical protein